MYSNPVNKLYLLFVMPYLQEFKRINKLFQQDRGNPFKLLECLLLFFRSLISRVVRPGMNPTSDEQLLLIDLTNPSVLLPVGAVNYGVTFLMALEEARMESMAEKNMKSRKSMTVFSPTVILSQAKPQLRSVSMLKLFSGDLTALETQYKQRRQPGRGILG